jgi:putative membrane protein
LVIFECLLGAFAGVIAGLIPGLHSNNIAVFVAASPFFGDGAMVFVLSMGIAQAFVEFIPSVFLSAPSEATFEGILPGHKMLLEGKGFEAVALSIFGGLIAVCVGFVFNFWMIDFLEQSNGLIIASIPSVLFLALILMLFSEKGFRRKLICLFVMLCASVHGLFLSGQIFPLIAGYFGLAGIIYSIVSKNNSTNEQIVLESSSTAESTSVLQSTSEDKQKVPHTISSTENNFLISLESFFSSLKGIIAGAIVSIMPGVGASTASSIVKLFSPNISQKAYLSMLGSVSVSNFFFSFAMLFALNKSRNGSISALAGKIFFTPESFLIGSFAMLFAAGIGALCALIIARKAAKFLSEKDSKFLSLFSGAIIVMAVFLFSGTQGIFSLILSTALGFFAIASNVKRSSCMASLIVPSIIFYSVTR